MRFTRSSPWERINAAFDKATPTAEKLVQLSLERIETPRY